MKTTKIYFIDLSRYYILSFYEQLKINNGYSKNPNNSNIPNPNHTNINSKHVLKPHVIMNAVFSHGLRNFSDQQESAILSNKITHKKSKSQDFKNNTTAISAQNSDEEALAAKKNSELNAPKKQGFFDKIVNVFNKASSPAGYAGEIAGNLANTDLQVGPILNEFAKKVSILGNAAVAMDFVNTTYNNMQSYQQGEMDCWQSAYNTVTHGISVTAGAGVCGTITASGAMGTFGLGAISAVTAGTLAGNATTKVIDFGFDWIEEKIWGEAK